MRQFFRILKYSWPYRRRLVASVVCALMVALFWSINLSAIYPVLKILSTDKNLQQWVDEEIDSQQRQLDYAPRLAELDRLRAALKRMEQESTPDRETQERKATQQIAKIEGVLNHHATWVYRYQLLKVKVIRHLPEDRFATVVCLLAAVVVGLAIKGVFEFFHDTLVGSVTNRTLFDLRNGFFRRCIHQDVRQLAETGTSELMARFTNDTEQIANGLKVLFGRMVGEPLKAIGCLVAASVISVWLTGVFIIIVPVAIYVLVRVSKMMRRAARKLLERMSAMYKLVRETFDANRAVKAFTQEPHERRRFRVASREYLRKAMRVIYIDAATGPIVEVLVVMAIGLALASGTYLVVTGKTDIFGYQMIDEPLGFATLLQLYAFLAATADPVRRLSSVYTKIQCGTSAANRIFELYDRMPTVKANPDGPRLKEVREKIEFRNVCFSYDPTNSEKPTLSTVNLSVRAGETIAIVGGNGSGKTTLLGLLPRFYDPSHGTVLIDGVNIRIAHLRSLRRLIGLVTQDTQLFDETVYDNIAYGKKGATAEEVVAAAKQARAHGFIERKQEGYKTRMGDSGANFSGGEKQKIALARAILRNPSILILDEFSNQIDSVSEADIHDALKDFVKGRTVFLITHKLSTLEIADRIVVMEAGELVDVGTHAELIVRCPRYQLLCDPGSGRKIGEEIAASAIKGNTEPLAVRDKLEFQKVSCLGDQDSGDQAPVSAFSLGIRAGEVIGLVGKDGCGSKTIVDLLSRHEEPDTGQVTLDGTLLRSIHLRTLRSLVGRLDLEGKLHGETVLANIARGKRGSTRAEVMEAARTAQAHEFIEQFAQGYDTPLHDGSHTLSHWQKRRLLMARMLLRKPSILVVNADHDPELVSILAKNTQGRTLIILAENPTSLTRVDRIVVMDAGKMIDCGTHAELMVRCTLYQQLCDAHSERKAA
jgi:ATP-binding cassette subfamily B protein/subfamily B ATP-binding cassette protein MsbA